MFKSEGSLQIGERVLWKGKPLKMPFLAPIFYAVAIFILVDACIAVVTFISGYNFAPILVAAVVSAIFISCISYVRIRDWKETEYTITNQRVFFDTMIGYDVVNMTDVRETYVKKGFLDRYYGTGKVFVTYRGFSPVTTFSSRGAQGTVKQKPPSFQSIKETEEVKRIIEDAAHISQLEKSPAFPS